MIGVRLFAAIVIGSTLLMATARSEGPVQADTTNAPSFGDQAWDFDHFFAVDIGSRSAGTEEERRAASYIANQLSGMHYTIDIVPFDFDSRFSSGRSQDVVAHAANEDPNAPLVIVGAHYDSVPAGPGANDNGSGTSTMLEVARELSETPIPHVAIRYVAFGAEEIGLLGSADYVKHMSDADRARVKLAISLDMLAVGDEMQFAGAEPWVDEARARAESQGYTTRDATASLSGLSDHQSFIDAGMPGILFHAEEDPAYHTARDVIERVQPSSMELMGQIAIGLIQTLSQ